MLQDRKSQHLDIVRSGRANRSIGGSAFDDITFEHVALPELALDQISLSTQFLGKRIKAPFIVSSMTGGPERSAEINRNIAIACEHLNIAMAVGSQRVALEAGGSSGLGQELRRLAPSVPLLGNLGAAQLNKGYGPDEARRAIEMIGADGLIIHLNPLQEAVQPEGDRDWRDLLSKIGTLAAGLGAPVVVKEVGSGISAGLARRLVDLGVAVIDVAGAGGTSWAAVESERAQTPRQAAVARAFVDWGQDTPSALSAVRASCPETTIIGSGGIRDGIDAAKAIRLGADVVGQAAGVLAAAMDSADAVIEHFEIIIEQLRVACFCTGSGSLADLRKARLAGSRLP